MGSVQKLQVNWIILINNIKNIALIWSLVCTNSANSLESTHSALFDWQPVQNCPKHTKSVSVKIKFIWFCRLVVLVQSRMLYFEKRDLKKRDLEKSYFEIKDLFFTGFRRYVIMKLPADLRLLWGLLCLPIIVLNMIYIYLLN